MEHKRLALTYRQLRLLILLASSILVGCSQEVDRDIPDICPVLLDAYQSYSSAGGAVATQWSSDSKNILFWFASLQHPSRWYITSPETGLTEPFDIHFDLPKLKDGRWTPSWSPVENIILLGDGTGLYRYEYDTAAITQLTQGHGKMLWSPDGQLITFIKGQGRRDWSWYVINVDGTNEREIIAKLKMELEELHPSEPKILALLWGTIENSPNNIGFIDIDSGQITQLTDTKDCEYHPRWSPDGRQIAYISRDGNQDIFVMDADGSNVINLTNTTPQHERDFSWSPDGSQILFTRYHAISIKTFSQEIYVMNADGSEQRPITDTPDEYEFAPVWSPDGRQIAFWSTGWIDEGAGSRWWQLHVINADGSDRRTLATFAAAESNVPAAEESNAPAATGSNAP